MLRLVKNTIKKIVFIPLFIFSSAALSETFTWSDMFQYIDSNGVVTIPEGYTEIGNNAFENSNVVEVILPNSITSIGDFAFRNSNIVKLIMPNSVTSIGVESFSNTQSLEEIVISDLVTTIPEHAFYMSNISNIDLSGILKIEYRAFFESGLKTVLLGEGVIIEYEAFKNSSLKHIEIPQNSIIESLAFFGLDELLSLDVKNNVTTRNSVGSYVSTQGHIFTESFRKLKTLKYESYPTCNMEHNGYYPYSNGNPYYGKKV